MKTVLIYIVALVTISPILAQSFYLGNSSTLSTGTGTQFFMGGNATINGRLANRGELVSYSNLNLVNNRTVGKLKFTGRNDQTLTGDSLDIESIILNKSGKLIINSPQLLINQGMDLQSGVIENTENLIVVGEVTSAQGYVEGIARRISTGNELMFPMGIDGFYNGISFSGIPAGELVTVTIRKPDPSTLLPDEEMIGISEDVEWVVFTDNPIETTVSVSFNGLDFTTISNGTFINADRYDPVIVKLTPDDTLHQRLFTEELLDSDRETFGDIISNQNITLSDIPTYFGIGLIPMASEPIFYVPNVFSPNATFEENKVFRPFFSGGNVTTINMTVWDVNRNEIYSYSDSDINLDLSTIGWDGYLANGQIANAGIYYFSIVLGSDGQVYEKHDSFLLAH